MAVNFNNTANAIKGMYVTMNNAQDWCIGVMVNERPEDSKTSPDGHVWDIYQSATGYGDLMNQTNHLTLFDTGFNSVIETDRSRYLLSGRGEGGAAIGTMTWSYGGTTVGGIGERYGHPALDNIPKWLIAQRRAGVIQLWRIVPGLDPELIDSNAALGPSSVAMGFQFGVSNYQSSAPYNHSIDRPFHTSARSFSANELMQISQGVRPSTIIQAAADSPAVGYVVFQSYSTASNSETITAWNPTDSSTLTLNGFVITFKTTVTDSSTQVAIGADSPTTVANLLAFLQASSDTRLTVATYSARSSSLRIQHNTIGSAGLAYTVVGSSTNMRCPVGNTLQLVDWEFGAINASGIQRPLAGSMFLLRTTIATWPAADADLLATPTTTPASINWIHDYTVYQQYSGAANLAVSGLSRPEAAAVGITVVDSADGTTVVPEVTYVATSGAWSGSLSIPKGKRWLQYKVREIGSSTPVTAKSKFGVGEIVALYGQSINEYLAGGQPGGVAPNGFVSRFTVTDASKQGAQGFASNKHPRNNKWALAPATTGAGEVIIANTLSDKGNCVVGLVNRARGDTPLQGNLGAETNWTTPGESWITAIANMRVPSIGHLVWIHGHADLAYINNYKTNLNTMLGYAKQVMGSGVKFHMTTLVNSTEASNGTVSSGSGDIGRMRQIQREWVDETRPSDPNIYLCCDILDMLCGVDGVHPDTNSVAPIGRIGERIANGIAYAQGYTPFSAYGGRITSVERSGRDIYVTVTHNTANGFAENLSPSGFEVLHKTNNVILTKTSTTIISSTQIKITLSTDPGDEVRVRYLANRPGSSKSGSGDSTYVVADDWSILQASEIYDNTPGYVYSPGVPLSFLQVPLLTVPLTVRAIQRRAKEAYGVVRELPGGWGLHKSGKPTFLS